MPERESAYEEAFEFACEYLEDSNLTPDELRRAAMVGVSRVKSRRVYCTLCGSRNIERIGFIPEYLCKECHKTFFWRGND